MDDKKKVKTLEIEVVLFIVLVVVIALWNAIVSFLAVTFGPALNYLNIDWSTVWAVSKSISGTIVGISFPLSLFFLIGIIYCVEQLKRIHHRQREMFETKVEPAYEAGEATNPALGERWGKVKSLVTSTNANDWRQAILEADIILEDILTSLGYQGEGIGEKLKRVVPGDMKSLNEAWEAHKVRNQIAHEGSEFAITQHEANRVINMYKKVFEEFYYIQ